MIDYASGSLLSFLFSLGFSVFEATIPMGPYLIKCPSCLDLWKALLSSRWPKPRYTAPPDHPSPSSHQFYTVIVFLDSFNPHARIQTYLRIADSFDFSTASFGSDAFYNFHPRSLFSLVPYPVSDKMAPFRGNLQISDPHSHPYKAQVFLHLSCTY